MAHGGDDSLDAEADGGCIEAGCLPSFEEDEGFVEFEGGLAECAGAEIGEHGDGCGEGFTQGEGSWIAGSDAELGEVWAVGGTGVEIDHCVAKGEDFCSDCVSDAAALGAFLGAGEDPIEVAAVRQVAGARGEGGEVDDGDGEEGSVEFPDGG